MNRTERLYFLVACGIKLALALLIHPGHPSGPVALTGVFAVRGGDSFSYIDPVENLFKHGTYAQDLARLETYAGRTPGYGLVYGALRLVAGPGGASDGVVVLQLLLGLVALYCLARLARQVTHWPAAFRWTALLYAASTFTTVFDIRVQTESFATSAAVIGVYLLHRARRQPSAGLLLRAGCWLGWAVFLRPFLAPWLGLVVVAYAAQALAPTAPRTWAAARAAVFRSALLALPFLVADAAWMARNWPWYHRLVPLQSNAWAGYKTAPALKELTEFVGIIGEEPAWWTTSNDVAWFYKPAADAAPNFRGESSKLAPPAYTYDSLVLVRRQLAVAQDSALPLATRQAAEARSAASVMAYKRAYQRLRPVHAYLLAPLKLAYRLTFAHPGDFLFQQPFAALPAPQKGLKILVHLWYWLVVGLGVLGLFIGGWKVGFDAFLVKAMPAYLVVLLCFVLHQVESRYFAVAYPFVVVSAVHLLQLLSRKIRPQSGR